MMQRKHAEVAAQHTLSILRWAGSVDPIDNKKLHDAVEAIYQDNDFGGKHSVHIGSYNTWKSITYDGVKLAYNHFFGQEPELSDIRKFLMEAGDHEDWGIISLEKYNGLR